MRLITRTIWRAFPELDRFGDDQCRRFVRAANSRRLARSGTWLVSLVVGAVVAAIAFAAPIWYRSGHYGGRYLPDFHYLLDHRLVNSVWFWVWWMSAGGLAAFVARDVLLRLRLRRLLRTRASCVQCRYSLLGLTVPPSLIVHCPECGTPTHVDAALGELTTDESGAARFTPSDLTPPPRWFTPRRVRILTRTALALFIGVPVLCGLAFGVYEWRLRSQARLAASQRLLATDLVRMVDAMQPSPMPANATSFFQVLRDLRFELRAANTALDQQHPFEVVDQRPVQWGDIATIYVPYDTGYSPTPYDLAVARRGRWQFDIYQQSKLPELLDTLATAYETRRDYALPPGLPAIYILLDDLGEARTLARYNAARMKVASGTGDTREWLRAFEANLALARGYAAQPLGIQTLVSASLELIALGSLRDALLAQPDSTTLDAIEAAMSRQHTDLSLHWIEGERAQTLDTIAWIFESPGHTRFNIPSDQVDQLLNLSREDPSKPVNLGTYEQNRREVSDFYDRLTQTFALRPHDRIRSNIAIQADLAPARVLTGSGRNMLNMRSFLEGERIGIHTIIALERYRIANGEYPSRLADLVPAFLPQDPQDLWAPTPQPLGYKRIDPAGDPHRRVYLLYTVAGDGIDNAGFSRGDESDVLTKPKPSEGPIDFVWNRPAYTATP